MYVAHTGADRIDVFDCAEARYLHALDGHPGVAGVLIDSALDVMLATDRGAARLSYLRVSDEKVVGQVAVGQRPNGVALDTRRMRAYTFDLGDPPGVDCTTTVVDLAASVVLARTALPGRPRWAAFDPLLGLVYANISDLACIVVIDSDSQSIARTIDVPSAGPHGLALIDGLLFCATDAGELVVLDATGTVRRRLPLAGAPEPLRWAIFGLLFVVTVIAQAELAEVFLLAGLIVVLVRARPRWLQIKGLPVIFPFAALSAAVTDPTAENLARLFLFFAKAGAFVFGSGLAIVPFLHQGVVTELGWLDERQFLDAVAVAIITPGPVVITVAFIGFLVAGPLGATAAAVGMFAPVWALTVLPAPWFKRNRDNAQLRAFAAGATAAATGAIVGAVVLLGRGAITDVTTVGVALLTFVALLRLRLPEPLIVIASAAVGLALGIFRS